MTTAREAEAMRNWKPACPWCGREFVRIGSCTWQNACAHLDVSHRWSHHDATRDAHAPASRRWWTRLLNVFGRSPEGPQ